jgi:PAS domain S-box-containing protein
LKLSLRAKFLLLSALVQALVVGLLIWNSLRIMDHAVSENADRVAHEYAVTLNLSLGPYASHGRLSELRSYLDEMLADPADSFVRYIVILDQRERPLVSAGIVPSSLVGRLRGGDVRLVRGLQTVLDGGTLHVRAPMLLQDNQVGTLNFGLSTRELTQAQSEVLSQSGLISLVGFGIGLVLLYVFTLGIGKRLHGLEAQCQRLARGDYGTLLREQGGDEIEIVSRSLNTMNLALRGRIGELERAERRLFESEERFKVLFDLAPVPLAVTDREGSIVAANLALKRAFGDSSDVAPGKNWSEAGFWGDGGESRRMLELYRQQGTLQGDIAAVRLAGGGAGRVAVWSSAHSLGGDRTLIWALLDLTAELEAKRALEELNASLESRVQERSQALENANEELSRALDTLQRTQHDLLAAEKMASLGSLVAGVAHELNTPIGNSLLASTTLSDRVGEFRRVIDDGALRRSSLTAHLDEVALASRLISGSLQKAANLIASFKQIAVDQTSDQRRVFDLLPAMQDTLTTYMPRLRRANCTATLTIPAGLTMDTYPGGLYQVFSNLLNNALVHAFEQRDEGLITVTAADVGNGQVEIVFDDDGAGMTAEVLRHVFDPFFTTKMGQGGTGLGMNIVYNIVTGVLGGRIDIKTRLGLGTTVRIVIPRTAPRGDGGKKPLAATAPG